ncbi:MAG: hypothetical protein ACK4ZD_06160 [Caldimonas sp.]|jgi:hypothetical protein|uniref:DUF7210 family protein n=1 Tax=Caldimonas sp. TaxID=2838790 RepID=UPI00391ACB5B
MAPTRVKLRVPHRHAGRDLAPGEVIEVPEAVARSLEQWGVGEIVTGAVPGEKGPAAARRRASREAVKP